MMAGRRSRRTGRNFGRTALSSAAADAWLLPIRGVKGFESAQVASGGASVADFDPATLQNRRLPGLYAAGEVLDVDGDCGGFNLMFAFGSGILAGLDGRNAPWTHENAQKS